MSSNAAFLIETGTEIGKLEDFAPPRRVLKLAPNFVFVF